MKMAFISDVHGNWDVYERICSQYENTIQVGDFGMGFENYIPHKIPYLSQNHRFIRGNHDDPAKCKAHPNYIKDGTIEIIGSSKVMFIGGAFSIDRNRRMEGRDWWSDEECTYGDFQEFIDIYEAEKPDVMVTHDCPADFAKRFLLGAHKPSYRSVTNNALEVMHHMHKPDMWFFGHWHTDLEMEYNGTMFVCRRDTSKVNDGVYVADL